MLSVLRVGCFEPNFYLGVTTGILQMDNRQMLQPGVHSRILNVIKQSTVFETKNRFIHGAISMQFSILLSSFWPINRFWYRSLFSYTLLLRSIARQTVNWIFS